MIFTNIFTLNSNYVKIFLKKAWLRIENTSVTLVKNNEVKRHFEGWFWDKTLSSTVTQTFIYHQLG